MSIEDLVTRRWRPAYTAPLSVVLATTLSLCGPIVASAADGPSQADDSAAQALATKYRAEAEQAFVEGDYEGAVAAFGRAHDTAPHPTDLFNLGRVREEQGELESALAHYEEFAALPRLSLSQRQAAAERIEVLRRIVAPDPPPRSMAGPTDSGQSDASLERDRSKPLIITGAVLSGVGAALAVSGGVGFGMVARRNTEEIERVSSGENPNRLSLAETEDLHSRGQNAETLQITFLAAGSVVALLGVGILTAGLVNRKRNRNVAVVPVGGPRFAGASARFSF